MRIISRVEPEVEDRFMSTVRRGHSVWDVGANIGWFALLAARHTQRVLAIEPSESNHRHIRDNMRRNGLAVTIIDAAVAEAPGYARFDSSDSRTGHLDQHGDRLVRLVTLDALAEEHGQPDLIKLDVEGAEVAALRGATRVLSAGTSVICECHHTQTQVTDLLEAAGYRVEVIEMPDVAPRDAPWWVHFWAVPQAEMGNVARVTTSPAPGIDPWMDRWHRGEIDAPRAAGESAAEWQRKLFDDLVRRDPQAAFGRGPLQDVFLRMRTELAIEYARAGQLTLDVGCGNGVVARAVAERTGGPVMGIDVSGECVRYAAEHNAHPAVEYRQDALEDFNPAAPIGLVTMYEVIEHVDDPQAALVRVRDWLAPGGHVILSTPNRSSLNRRIKTLPGIRWLYTRLSGLSPDGAQVGHVEEYRYDEMIRFVKSAGLELTKARGVVLLLPFPGAIGPLARSPWFARLNARSGDWYPPLAGSVYLIARRPA